VATFDDIDAGLTAILRAEGVERFDLAGQSYGGFLAQAFLARHPERVRRLVLSGSGPADYGRGWQPVLGLAIPTAGVLPRALLARVLMQGLAALLPPLSERGGEWRRVVRQVVGQDLIREDVISHLGVAADVARSGRVRRGNLVGWDGQVVVLSAGNDPTRGQSTVARLGRLLGRPVRTVDTGEAGHLAVLLDPQRFACCLKEALT
jgi:pimeloyl-ACP methyl ester carboxylesterase